MRITGESAELRGEVDVARRQALRIGLVPTLGALHEGHVSLAVRARGECGFVIASVFVNPLQFGPGEDLDAYPRDLPGDCARLAAVGVDLVFAPSVAEVYPDGPPLTTVKTAGLAVGLEGAHRPGHFDGVTTVVAKLLALCEPDAAYFGRKDAQQLAVVTRMARDLSFRAEIVACPTIRESDGLAMSSRNAYLSRDERAVAPVLYRALRDAAGLAAGGEREPRLVAAKLRAGLESESRLDIDYATVVDAGTLEVSDRMEGDMLLAVAARLGRARLIENFTLHGRGDTVDVDEGEIKGEP